MPSATLENTLSDALGLVAEEEGVPVADFDCTRDYGRACPTGHNLEEDMRCCVYSFTRKVGQIVAMAPLAWLCRIPSARLDC